MDVTVQTEKTFVVSMTETQARDLLTVASSQGATKFTDSEKETKKKLRLELLESGLRLKDSK